MKRIGVFLGLYNPVRLYRVFRFLLTVFLLLRRKASLLRLRPLSPAELLTTIQILGPSFIKLSQVLATRADFFEPAYLAELRGLHDQIPQMPPGDLAAVFKRAFGEGEAFSYFEMEAFASASIGQVHFATLAEGGEKVAVKLRRRNIEIIVREDIRILGFFRRLFHPLFSEYTKNSVESVLEAFSRMILREVDMALELINLEKFSRVYARSGIRFPGTFPALSSREALVMSCEQGVRFDDRDALARLEVPFEPLMEKLVLFYTEQMLVRGYFHADPHPGNLLVNEAGELVLLDFGMVTRIPSATRTAMIGLVKAAYEKDFELLVLSARKLGIVTADAPSGELEELTERIFDIFDDATLSASSMQQLVFDLLQSMRSMPFKLPQEIIYVMRVSAIIEGLGTVYIENFNGIKDILPILKANLSRALGERTDVPRQVANELRHLPFTLMKARKLVEEMHEGAFTVHIDREDRRQVLDEIKGYARRVVFALVVIAAGLLLRPLDFPGQESLSWILVGGGLIRLAVVL